MRIDERCWVVEFRAPVRTCPIMTGRIPRISPVLGTEANFLVKTCKYRQQVTGGSDADRCDRDIAMGVQVMIESGRTVLAWGRGSGCDEPDIRGDHEEAVNQIGCFLFKEVCRTGVCQNWGPTPGAEVVLRRGPAETPATFAVLDSGA
jgi:hypothetical protein